MIKIFEACRTHYVQSRGRSRGRCAKAFVQLRHWVRPSWKPQQLPALCMEISVLPALLFWTKKKPCGYCSRDRTRLHWTTSASFIRPLWCIIIRYKFIRATATINAYVTIRESKWWNGMFGINWPIVCLAREPTNRFWSVLISYFVLTSTRDSKVRVGISEESEGRNGKDKVQRVGKRLPVLRIERWS